MPRSPRPVRLALAGTVIALAACAVAPATVASAAPTVPASASTAADRPLVTSFAQQTFVRDQLVVVRVALGLSTPNPVDVRDDQGRLVATTPTGGQTSLMLRPDGQDHARYTVVSRDGAERTDTITVDFSGLPLDAPSDHTDTDEVQRISRAVAGGSLDHTLRVTGVPGATITLTVNGVATSATADATGSAALPAHFTPGQNAIALSQSLGAKQSVVRTYGYQLGGGR